MLQIIHCFLSTYMWMLRQIKHLGYLISAYVLVTLFLKHLKLRYAQSDIVYPNGPLLNLLICHILPVCSAALLWNCSPQFLATHLMVRTGSPSLPWQLKPLGLKDLQCNQRGLSVLLISILKTQRLYKAEAVEHAWWNIRT